MKLDYENKDYDVFTTDSMRDMVEVCERGMTPGAQGQIFCSSILVFFGTSCSALGRTKRKIVDLRPMSHRSLEMKKERDE